MKYQLVLQFPATGLRDFDELITLEDRIAAALESGHVVDGHDFGSGEMNIFIHSDDPAVAFATARSVVDEGPLGPSLRAGYRRIDGEEYATIWPPGMTDRFEVK